jgi:hypothetical protein
MKSDVAGNTMYGPHNKFRSLDNYIEQHPKAMGALTLTEARKMVYGVKSSMHGIRGKTLNSEGRTFWMGLGYNV